jgi:hypothetical protein
VCQKENSCVFGGLRYNVLGNAVGRAASAFVATGKPLMTEVLTWDFSAVFGAGKMIL